MLKPILLYAGAALTTLWGIAHLFPTKSVVKGFGRLSADNKNILTMEWITEGIFLIFIGRSGCSGDISGWYELCGLDRLPARGDWANGDGPGLPVHRFQGKIHYV